VPAYPGCPGRKAIEPDVVVVVVVVAVAVAVVVVVGVVVVNQTSFLKFFCLAGPLEITGAITGQMQFLSLNRMLSH